MKKRDLKHRIAWETFSDRDWAEFVKVRDEVKHALRSAERDYVQNQTASTNNERSIWKIIRNCIPSNVKSYVCKRKNPSELCEEFHDYFVSVGERAAKLVRG